MTWLTCEYVNEPDLSGFSEMTTHDFNVVLNDVSKAFHEDVCHSAQKVVAKGTVTEAGGKEMLTLTKIEIAKK